MTKTFRFDPYGYEVEIGKVANQADGAVWFRQGGTIVLATVYSVDKEHAPHVLAFIASSLALSISKIPLLAPVGIVEVARVDGQWVLNPLYQEALKSDVRLIIAGTEEGICMVEGSS